MKKLFIVIASAAALFVTAPIGPADAQTVVFKRGHGHSHGHVHHPRKKVVVIERGRRHGLRHHDHRRGHGHMRHNHGTTGVGVTIR